ncbi:MAG TPA: MotA/TolQ/ExbB proton channel family protein, partial [Gemmataceae bacterium]|nr:MotA/TolQ/ExbB proton channel family protein [Gemmataceae bacterium]
AAAPTAAAAADNGTEPAPAPKPEEGLFWHIVKSAGPIFGPLLLFLSIALVALIVMLSMDLRLSVAIPPTFVEQFTDTVNKRKFKEAFELARADPSFLGKVLTGGMSRLQYGIEDARDAAQNMVESLRSSKEQLNNYTAVISSLGPLVGLVGTVFGMILAFKALAQSKLEQARLADAISHALVITMLGIGIAVPGLFFNAFFRNRITRISMDTANIADDLLTQMYHNSKKPSSTVTAAVSPAGTQTVPTK